MGVELRLGMPDAPKPQALAALVILNACNGEGSGRTVQLQRGTEQLQLQHGTEQYTGVQTICKLLCSALQPAWYPEDPAQQALVDQWLNFVPQHLTPLMDARLAELNAWLAPRAFFVGAAPTLADIVLYATLSPAITKFPVAQQSVFSHLLRWYDHIHYSIDRGAAPLQQREPACPAVALPPLVVPKPPAPAPPPMRKPAAAPASATPDVSAKTAASAKASPSVAAATSSSSAKSTAATASDGAAPPAAAAAGTSAAAAGTEKKGKAKDAKAAERAAKNAAKQAPAKAAEPSIDMLNIRVGTIVSVDRHLAAENLYVEKIDLGEAEPRTVISGLVKHVPQNEMQGRRVAVVCNLKPAKMRDVMSHGMVLCASTDAAVEPVAVPEGVPNGERLMVAGYDGEAEEQLNPKKRVLEALLPDMATNADGCACFKGVPFTTSKGPVTSTISNAPVK